MIARLRQRAAALRVELYALQIAGRDPRTPWYAKALLGLVLAYAFSPIDLIPDFIPVLGYLDDLILVPLGILLAVRMIPPQVLAEARTRAQASIAQGQPSRLPGALLILAIWLLLLAAAVWIILKIFLHSP